MHHHNRPGASALRTFGIATLLIKALMRFAQAHGFRELSGVVLPENHAMLALARSLGFTIDYDAAEHVMRIARELVAGPIESIVASTDK